MKRIGNIYPLIYDLDNLRLADQKAMKGKSKQYGVKLHLKDQQANIQQLHQMLKSKTYRTSEYSTFTVFEPKERLIFRLPYFPDRITHHAVMNVLEEIFINTFTADTYSCIKGKGIKACSDAVKEALRDVPNTKYCLKMDIKKFYPSIDHEVLKTLLRRKFKDQDLLWLLDEIIDSTPGLPIGNYLSQYFANFYLTYFDHWIKEEKKEKYYFRYADDLVILSDSKPHLHALLSEIRHYLEERLKLRIKENYQIFPVEERGIDFVGYVFRHRYIRLRKGIKKNFARAVAAKKDCSSIAAYIGWVKHCNGKHLVKKLLHGKV